MEEKVKKPRAPKAPNTEKEVKKVVEDNVSEATVEPSLVAEEFPKEEEAAVEDSAPEVMEQPAVEPALPVVEEPAAKEVKAEQSRNLRVGEAYIEKLNKFLSNSLSKYVVKLVTSEGEREIMKAAKDKAYRKACNLNKVKGFGERVIVKE